MVAIHRSNRLLSIVDVLGVGAVVKALYVAAYSFRELQGGRRELSAKLFTGILAEPPAAPHRLTIPSSR